jgi:hypothetical protein
VQALGWWCALILIATLPICVLLRRGAAWQMLLLGPASYVLGMALKGLLFTAAAKLGLGHLSAAPQSAVAGLVSAAAELGAAALFLRRPLKTVDVLAFGASIGVFEMLFLLPIGWLDLLDQTHRALPLGRIHAVYGWGFLLERGLTLAGHTASRALLYVGLRLRSPALVLLEVALFTLNDGFATYTDLRQWTTRPEFLLSMDLLAAAMTLIETGIAATGFHYIKNEG